MTGKRVFAVAAIVVKEVGADRFIELVHAPYVANTEAEAIGLCVQEVARVLPQHGVRATHAIEVTNATPNGGAEA